MRLFRFFHSPLLFHPIPPSIQLHKHDPAVDMPRARGRLALLTLLQQVGGCVCGCDGCKGDIDGGAEEIRKEERGRYRWAGEEGQRKNDVGR